MVDEDIKDKPSKSDKSELELGSEEGKEDVSTDDGTSDTDEPKEDSELEKLKDLTGKDFKSGDDFKKHYKNLSDLVGDQTIAENRKKAGLYDKLQEEAKGALEDLGEEEKKKVVDKVEKDETKDKVDKLSERLNKSEFLRENPDAKGHFELIEAINAKRGKGFQDAWDSTVKELVAAKSEKDKEHSEIIDSNEKTSPTQVKKINQLADKVVKTDSLDDKEKLVTEVLGASE